LYRSAKARFNPGYVDCGGAATAKSLADFMSSDESPYSC